MEFGGREHGRFDQHAVCDWPAIGQRQVRNSSSSVFDELRPFCLGALLPILDIPLVAPEIPVGAEQVTVGETRTQTGFSLVGQLI